MSVDFIRKLDTIAENYVEKHTQSIRDDISVLLEECISRLTRFKEICRKFEDADTYLHTYELAYVYYQELSIILDRGYLDNVPENLQDIYKLFLEKFTQDKQIDVIQRHLLRQNKTKFVSSELLAKFLMAPERDKEWLIIDVRSRLAFQKAHIACHQIICMEPDCIMLPSHGEDVWKKFMLLAPPQDISLFQKRSTFAFIVLYNEVYEEYGPLDKLYDLLSMHTEKSTKVLILNSGFDEWVTNGRAMTKRDDQELETSIEGDNIYINGHISGLPKQNTLELSPSLENQILDSSMLSMLSPKTNVVLGQQQPKSKRSSSLKRFFMYNNSNSDKSTKEKSKESSPPYPISHTPTQKTYLATSFTRSYSSPTSGNEKLGFLKYPDTPVLTNKDVSVGNQALIPTLSSRSITSITTSSQAPYRSVDASNNPRKFNTLGLCPPKPAISSNMIVQPSPVLGASYESKSFEVDFSVGLINLGNSCYLNCIIQCLLGTQELTKIFLDKSFEKHINLNSKLGSKGVLARYFSGLVHMMYQQHLKNKKISNNKSNTTPIRPLKFKMACGSVNSLFKNHDQQDCHEFCQFLLDGLHEDLNQCGSNTPLKPLSSQAEQTREKLSIRIASSIEWERYLTNHFSVIVDLFQGQYASRLECNECSTTSTTYQAFSVISIPISAVKPGRNSVTLWDCFEEFTKRETLGREEAWFCPNCKKKQPSTKQIMITRLPRNLIIHLKRFDNMMNKDKVFVDYPLSLDLTEFWVDDFDGNLPPGVQIDDLPARGQLPPFHYALYGVACHFGTLYGGHYTSYVKKGARQGWIYFDDAKPVCIPPQRVPQEVVTSHAYVLFYCRTYKFTD